VVLTSEQISQINSQYMNSGMGMMQNAAMIGANGPMAESLTGGAINRMGAIGGPLAMGAASIAGLDPISIGLRAGMGASRMGLGFMGAGTVGLGAAGLAGGTFMAAGYAANQMFTGAQQQQQFNSSMNSTFRFANQYGGYGFGRSGLGDIGSQMRQMTTEQGPMGQMVGFEELGRLASNMGRMGMAQGIRDAKEFSTKFREMVKSVKEIAESMGTNLEEAQRMMSEMRGSGVFGASNAGRAAQRIRAAAVGGGLATSEVTGMMSVGSQISRMVGGRGRAGAMGGIETISSIGAAQRMGIISEEDIYNVTGLTGAEGRRAMATRQMEQSAQFFQTSNGRRMLASIAGRNGTLDAGSVEELMSGGVSTDRTMQMANRNLGKIGRANFIRNEGKLRGAALEQLGGLAPMLQMKQWLEEKGVNVNEDADRAMIFMQRQLGMGNDEAEMMLRQVRELPQIMRQRQAASQDDAYMHRLEERRSNTGIEGIKKKFEGARSEVQAALQQAGASFYEATSDYVESFINRVTGTYVKETRKDLSGSLRTALGGGAFGQQAAKTTFGLGSGKLSSIFGSTNPFSGGGKSDLSTFQGSDAERYANQGFTYKGGNLTDFISSVSQISNAFQGGDAALAGREGIQALGKAGAGDLMAAFRDRKITGKGMDRLSSFGSYLEGQKGKGNVALDTLATKYANAGSDIERAQIMSAATGEGGAGLDQSASFLDPGLRGVFGTSKFRTEREGDVAIGEAFSRGTAATQVPMDFMGNVVERGMYLGTNADPRQIGNYLRSEGGRGLMSSIFQGDKKTRDAAFRDVSMQIMKLQDKEGRSPAESGQLDAMRGIVLARQLNEMRVNGASKADLEAEAQRLAKENGIPVEQVRAQVDTILNVADESTRAARAEMGERAGEETRGTILAQQRSGLVTGSGKDLQLNAGKVNKLVGKDGTASRAFLAAMVEKERAFAQIGPNTSPADLDRLFATGVNAGQRANGVLANMSVAEQRRLAGSLEGMEGTEDVRADLRRNANVTESIEKGGKRGGKFGGLQAAAGALGTNISAEEIAKMVKEGGVRKLAERIAKDTGLDITKNGGAVDALAMGLESIQGGKAGVGAQAIQQFMGSSDVQKAKVDKAQSEDPNKNLETIRKNSDASLIETKRMVGYLAAWAGEKKPDAEAKPA
jgi:hypothetical protein